MYIGTRLRIIWYTRPSIKPYLGFLFIMGGLLAMMASLRASGKMDATSWAIFRYVGGGIILCVLLPYFGGYLRILKALRRADQEDRLEDLCEDFEEAKPIAEGYARLGQNWFFGKGGRNVVVYEEIRHTLLHENYAGMQRNQRELHYVDAKGKKHPLCGLPLFGKKGLSIAGEIMEQITQRQAEIQQKKV